MLSRVRLLTWYCVCVLGGGGEDGGVFESVKKGKFVAIFFYV